MMITHVISAPFEKNTEFCLKRGRSRSDLILPWAYGLSLGLIKGRQSQIVSFRNEVGMGAGDKDPLIPHGIGTQSPRVREGIQTPGT